MANENVAVAVASSGLHCPWQNISLALGRLLTSTQKNKILKDIKKKKRQKKVAGVHLMLQPNVPTQDYREPTETSQGLDCDSKHSDITKKDIRIYGTSEQVHP